MIHPQVFVFQPGPIQTVLALLVPALASSTGIYWLVPYMTFSILVGLSLDYDILVRCVTAFCALLKFLRFTEFYCPLFLSFPFNDV